MINFAFLITIPIWEKRRHARPQNKGLLLCL